MTPQCYIMYYIYYGQSLHKSSKANFCLKFQKFFSVCIFIRTNLLPWNWVNWLIPWELKPNFYKIRFSDFIPRADNVTILCNFNALQIVHLFSLNEKPEPSYYFCLPSVLESQLTQIIIRLSTALVAGKSVVIKTYTVPFETVRKSKRHKRS